jgi:hypothetical protein
MTERMPVIRLRNQNGTLLARDGVVLCFFMRRSHEEVASAVWRALQTYLRAIPPNSLNWYGSDDGDTLPLDDKGWEIIRRTLLDRRWGGARIVELDELCSEVGGYHFEYHGRRLDAPMFSHDEGSTCGMSFSFPTEYLLEHGPAHLRALALEMARELPLSFGYASLAAVSPRGQWYPVRKELLGLLCHYYGLDFYHLSDTSRIIGTGARGAYWLTFLGQPLLGQIGGERLRQQLSFPEVSLLPMEGDRVLITLGEWPDALDTTQGHYVPQYHELACLLEPYFPEETMGWTPMAKSNMYHWLRRLCRLPWSEEIHDDGDAPDAS